MGTSSPHWWPLLFLLTDLLLCPSKTLSAGPPSEELVDHGESWPWMARGVALGWWLWPGLPHLPPPRWSHHKEGRVSKGSTSHRQAPPFLDMEDELGGPGVMSCVNSSKLAANARSMAVHSHTMTMTH
ncbi:hypothetical protein P7K49_002380 [Saguinus oedipus]|uniref:Uncharacterized protein n=1 Tax=Saguinus oedipus TaxID=9490 RepID=A0ABQ9WH76_SAGOE|nr:hypothetical protein P7K49_002380 [Saguinus oedipus]